MPLTGRALAEVVGLCGAIPASLAVSIAASSTKKSATAHYASIQALTMAGVVETVTFKEVGLQRAAGLGMILIPGPHFQTRLPEFWHHPRQPVTPPTSIRLLAQHVLLIGALMRQMALGDRLLRGTAWLQAVAKEPMPWVRGGRPERVARADIGNLLRFPEGIEPLGYIPQEVSDRNLPTLVVGGLGCEIKALAKVASVAAWVAPLGILTPYRGARNAEKVRRVVAKNLRTKEYSPVIFLPRGRGEPHRRFWLEVSESVQMGAGLRDLLAQLRALGAE